MTNSLEKEIEELTILAINCTGTEPTSSFKEFEQVCRTALIRQREEGFIEGAEWTINKLGSNPNPNGAISPNLPHWIENQQIQLRQLLRERKDK